jgi:putative redox protein
VKNDREGDPADVRPDLRIGLNWRGELRFDAGPAGVTPIRIDGDTKESPSPTQTLLSALAACATADVVLMLTKQRTPPASLTVDASAERVDGTPRRFSKVHLHYRIAGDGITREQALRAIELGVTRYCSVRDSLDPEIPVTWSLDLSASARGSRAVVLEEVSE